MLVVKQDMPMSTRVHNCSFDNAMVVVLGGGGGGGTDHSLIDQYILKCSQDSDPPIYSDTSRNNIFIFCKTRQNTLRSFRRASKLQEVKTMDWQKERGQGQLYTDYLNVLNYIILGYRYSTS